ncbi:MAG TPA: hypothetical protein PKC88_16345, partial [Plasticicumulans sp.]|nr:hypothetical protein [Plasticicumulans sp.]
MTIDSAAGSPVPPCVLVLGRDLAAARAYAARLVHAGYRAVAGVPALDSAPVAALLLGGEGESEGTAWAEAVAPRLGDLPSRIETGPLPEDFAGPITVTVELRDLHGVLVGRVKASPPISAVGQISSGEMMGDKCDF